MSTVIERILIHLSEYQSFENSHEVPYDITQRGIADRIGISRGHASREILRMKRDGLITEDLKHVTESKKQHKVYSLTDKGYRRVQALKEKLKDENVTVLTEGGEESIKLKNIGKYIHSQNPLLTALNQINDEGVIDITFSSKDVEKIFFGRQKEMSRLKDILQEVIDEGAKTVLIKGEAGVGKTRLVSEFKKHVNKKGHEFLSGRAYSGSSEPYLPFKEALEKKIEEDKGKDYLPFFLGVKPSPAVTEKKDLNSKRKSLWHDLGSTLKKRASKNPLVIFLDDLQWADQATILMLNYLTVKLSNAPALFIGTYRPEDVHVTDPIKDLISHLTREHLLERIELGCLDMQNTREMIPPLIGRRDIPDDFVHLVHDITEGNPLFIIELVKHMLDEGIIDVKNNHYPVSSDDVEKPKIIDEIIKRRIRNIKDDETKRLLKLGGVIGESIPFELLYECADLKPLTLMDRIERLIEEDLWYEETHGENFSFSHGLIQKTVYKGIPQKIKEKLHLLVAKNIENIYEKEDKRYFTDLGHHYESGNDLRKAIDCYIKAGEVAEGVYAYEDAIEMYEKGMKLSKELPSIKSEISRPSILEKLADAYKVMGKYDDALEKYQKLLKNVDDNKHKATLYGKLADVFEKKGGYKDSLEHSQAGISLTSEDDAERCELLNKKGWALLRKGDHDEAIRVFEEEMYLSERLGEAKKKAQSMHDIGTIYAKKGNYNVAEDYLKQAVDLREKIRDEEGLSTTYNNIGTVYRGKGDLDKALDYYQQGLEMREKVGGLHGISTSLNNIGLIHADKGELDKALDYYQQSLKIRKDIGDPNGIALSFENIGTVYQTKTEFDKALEYFQRSLEISKDIGDLQGIAWSFNCIGSIHQEKGELDKALYYFDQSLKIAEEIGVKQISHSNLTSLVDIYIKKEEINKAEENAFKAVQIAIDMGTKPEEGKSQYILGMVYREKEKWKEAIQEFEKGIEILKEIQDKTNLVRAHCEYGLMWEKKGEEEKAKELFKKGLTILEGLNNDRLRKRYEQIWNGLNIDRET